MPTGLFLRFFRNVVGWESKARVWPGQARESMVIDVHPSKFRKHHF